MWVASKGSIPESPVSSRGNCHKADLVSLYLSSVLQVYTNVMQDCHETWQVLQKAVWTEKVNVYD